MTEGETGLLCPFDDADAWAAALGRLLEDAPLRRRMGEAARRRAERLWRWEHVVARLESEVYRPLISGTHPG